MKITNKIKIIGFDWEIVTGKKGDDVSYEGSCFGSTHVHTQKIFLDKDTSQQNQEQCFIHEILHAIWWQVGLSKRKDIGKNLDEEIIHPLAQGLYQVLKDGNLLK